MNFIERAADQLDQRELLSRDGKSAQQGSDKANKQAADTLEKARNSRRSVRSQEDTDKPVEPDLNDVPDLDDALVRQLARQDRKRLRQGEANAAAEQPKALADVKKADRASADEGLLKKPRAAKLARTTGRTGRTEAAIDNSSLAPDSTESTELFDTVEHSMGSTNLSEPNATSTQILDSDSGQSTAPKTVVRIRKHRGKTGGKVKINLGELFAEGYLGAEGKAGLISEEFRRIKRPLLANAYGQGLPAAVNGERIMVTSALPGEGKSFCAIHLALSIASEAENSVVLVEADVAKPTVLSKLGVRARKGLSNWFADPTIDVRNLTVETEIAGLKIVPAGKGAPDSIDMLASRAMTTFFDRLREAYPHDIIIVDAPPLLPATETKVLATNMGQVVVVVEAGVTPKSVVADALEMLQDIEIVGLVMNKSLRQPKNAGYGYGYGY